MADLMEDEVAGPAMTMVELAVASVGLIGAMLSALERKGLLDRPEIAAIYNGVADDLDRGGLPMDGAIAYLRNNAARKLKALPKVN